MLDIRFAEYRANAGDFITAEELARSAAERLRELGDERAAALALGVAADVLQQRGDLGGALYIRREVLLQDLSRPSARCAHMR